MKHIQSPLLYMQKTLVLLKSVRHIACCAAALFVAFPAQSIYIENKTGQAIRIHLISQDGFELTKDWYANESYNYAYAFPPLFISVYANETGTCTKFCSRGSVTFDSIVFGSEGKCIIGRYKKWQGQGYLRTTGSYQGALFRKGCWAGCWSPITQEALILTLEKQESLSLLHKTQTSARRAPQKQEAPKRRGPGRAKKSEKTEEATAGGLRIQNRLTLPVMLRMYTSDCDEIFCDIGQNGEYHLKPGQYPINITVYLATGNNAPCIGFPGISMDQSFDELTVASDKDMTNKSGIALIYRQSALGANAPTTKIQPNANYSRNNGWNSNTQKIITSTFIPGNLPPQGLVGKA